MAKAGLGSEIVVSFDNKIGILRQVCRVLSAAQVNITAVSGYIVEGRAFLRLVTSDNPQAQASLAAEGYKVEERQIVWVEADNRSGALEAISEKIEEAGIDLKYIYASSPLDSGKFLLILSSSNNEAAERCLES